MSSSQMERREFLKTIGLSTLAMGLPVDFASGLQAEPELSITMDDPNCYITPLFDPAERDQRIRESLKAHDDLRAALFVCGQRVDSKEGKALLQRWNDAGHLIGNHSYSHLYYHSPKITFKRFSEDLLRGEAHLSDLSRFGKFFRFPFLKEGDTKEKRDSMREFLKEQGYRIGHVTIDASDWYVDDRLKKALKKNPRADLTPYRDYYIRHILDRATYYDQLVRDVVGRTIPHTLLVHHNLLNALFLSNLMGQLTSDGWKLINADRAFSDSVYSREPDILPAGESLIWALAKETRHFEDQLRYPGEDGEYEKNAMDSLGL